MAAPDGLSARGKALWDDVTRSTAFDPAGRVLLEEACRCADRLERLHGLIDGDEGAWAVVTVVGEMGGVEATLKVDAVLAEARAQQTVLRGLLGHLRLGRGAAYGAGPEGGDASPPTEPTGGGLDDLGAARARRRAETAAAGGTTSSE